MCWKIVQQSEKRTETKSRARPGQDRRSQEKSGKKSVKQRKQPLRSSDCCDYLQFNANGLMWFSTCSWAGAIAEAEPERARAGVESGSRVEYIVYCVIYLGVPLSLIVCKKLANIRC